MEYWHRLWVKRVPIKIENMVDYSSIADMVKEQVTNNAHRIGKYGTISGYISATRLLKEMTDDDFLQKWRDRVGHAEADRITKESAARGTRMHELIESYWNGDAIEPNVANPGDYHYNKILSHLSDIKPILVEATLFSDKLEITGKVDTVGLYKDVISIIDYKTSRKPKKIEWMRSYGVQVALYSIMVYDMTGIAIKQGVLLNAPDDEDDGLLFNPAQVIVFQVSDYVKDAIRILNLYRKGERKCVKL